jgi:diguanylate cyclase (GGDEF)-like protein
MVSRDEIDSTEDELRHSRERGDRLTWLFGSLGVAGIGLLTIPAAALANAFASGLARYPLTGAFAMALGVPILVVSMRVTGKQQQATATLMDALRHDLTTTLEEAEHQARRREVQANRQEFETRLANALDMAEGEPEVIDVVERAFVSTLSGAPVELLLADNSHAHLTRMASSAFEGQAPMCGVDSPHHCPAARRAQVQRFPDSDALDACPKLRGREQGRCSAVCVPVSIMGRTVGVIHAAAPYSTTFEATAVQDLGTLANLAGARIGLLRMMADTQLQAATDSLTGLLNRRSLENEVRALREITPTLVAVMADLDHFKHLNDTYGHDTGDRALRLFAQTLRSSLREQDLVCRYGGEEFALIVPDRSAEETAAVLEDVRAAMAAATKRAGLPTVTASFGVVDAHRDEDLVDLLARADVALFQAKHDGRDRVVTHADRRNATIVIPPIPASFV